MSGERGGPGPFADLNEGQVEEVLGILEGYWDKLESGEQPSFDDLVAQHPQYGSLLRGHVEALDHLYEVAADGGPLSPDEPATPDARVRGRLGDFRIVRQVGRGGMGVVYEAEQLSLGRRVALKVLPFAATLDARQLRRFKNEAQAAAQLHHNHIVPVFAVGCDRGVHYYAMQFIDGRTLAQVIADLRASIRGGIRGQASANFAASKTAQGANEPPTVLDRSTERSITRTEYFRSVAQMGVQAAEALEHAHQAGILHRDIKPGNLLVGEDGHLWVTDFGLSRCRTEPGMTATGDLLGTLRYMSPEQALAKRDLVDHRSDIYSLGVTLYEALTLEPAYAGVDREELLRQIAQGEPRAPRRLNRAIPVDVETVVLKGMAREPRDRYATAQELADDLRRYLEHRPVQARRPSMRERAAKWALRHKQLVAAGVVMLLLAAVGLAVSTLAIWREKEQTRAALNRVEDNFAKMLDGTRGLLIQLEDPRWGNSPEITGLREHMVVHGVALLQEFVREDNPDPAIRFQSAKALGLIACVYCAHQKVELAEGAISRAFALLDRLVAEFPQEPTYRKELAIRHDQLGFLYKSLNRRDKARREFLHEADILRPGLPYDTTGVLTNNLGWLLADCPITSLRRPAEAVALAQQALERVPQEGGYWNTLGVAHYRNGNYAAAARALDKSIALRRYPGPEDWFFLAMACWQRGQRRQAQAWYERSVRWMWENPPLRECHLRYRAEAQQLFRTREK
jgi:serine/threonine protein kinase/Tfp pilus assembly protein PilF